MGSHVTHPTAARKQRDVVPSLMTVLEDYTWDHPVTPYALTIV